MIKSKAVRLLPHSKLCEGLPQVGCQVNQPQQLSQSLDSSQEQAWTHMVQRLFPPMHSNFELSRKATFVAAWEFMVVQTTVPCSSKGSLSRIHGERMFS